MPFGVDLSNAEFKNPTDTEQSSPSGDTPSSGDAAPSGEAFKEETGAKSSHPEVVQTKESKEYSKEDLERMLGIEETIQSTQDFKKFDDNFGFDLATLIKDPSQFSKFAQIYPPQYVERAKQVLMNNGINPYGAESPQKPNDLWSDPRMQEILQMAEAHKHQQKEQRIASINQKLDSSFESLGKKYPEADKNIINFYLQGLNQKGISLMDDKGNIRTSVLEKLFKADHEAREKAYEAKYRAKVDAQKRMNLKSKDMGSGGSIGTVEGKNARTIKEATKALMSDIRATR